MSLDGILDVASETEWVAPLLQSSITYDGE